MSALRIHHLNCGSLCPRCNRFVTGAGGYFENAVLPCHCLLIETPESLVLVDTGIGVEDIASPAKRLTPVFTNLARPKLDLAETALHQVRALGFDPRDVKHIVATHLDLDHTGGLPDFPEANVHVYQHELDASLFGKFMERNRLRRAHIAHKPKWVTYETSGDQWFGFDSVRIIPGISAEIALIPLPGHTSGNCGVAVRNGEKWLLHAGDAYFHHSTLSDHSKMPLGISIFERMLQTDQNIRLKNQARLRELKRNHGDEVDIFCSHDPDEFKMYSALK